MKPFINKSKKRFAKYTKMFVSLAFAIVFVGVGAITYAYNVSTEVSPSEMGISLVKPSGAEETTGMKKGEDGTYAYCLDPNKGSPANTEYSEGSRGINDKQYAVLGWCFPSYRYTGCNEIDYFISQTAVWNEFSDNFNWSDDTIKMNKTFTFGESGYTPDFDEFTGKKGETITEEDVRTAIASLCGSGERSQQAYYAMSNEQAEAKASDEYDNDFVTDLLYINQGNNAWTGNESFKLTFQETNYDAVFIKEDGTEGKELNVTKGDKFRIKIPKDKITADGSIVYFFSGSVSGWTAGNYNPVSDGGKQPLALIWKDTLDVSNKASVKWGKLPTEKLGEVKIKKTDEDWNKLEGATFTLTNSEGDKTKATTNSKGIAKWKDLKPGKYTIKETEAPDGYELSDKKFKVTVEENSDETVSAGTCVDKKKPTKIKTPPKKGKLKLTKVDEETNAPLKGAKFEVWDKDQKAVVDTQVTDANGLATFELPIGTYYYKEAQAPEGYELKAQWNKLEVTDTSDGLTQAFKVTNKKPGKPPYTSEIHKKDITTGEPVGNAGFTIYGEDQMTVVTSGITDNMGICKFTLDKGTFYFQETLAPVGYKLNEDKVKFVIDDNNRNVVCDVSEEHETTPVTTPNLSQLQITKTDVSTGKLLPNATFNIYSSDKKTIITSGSTDTNGLATFTLPTGDYYYQEFSAPDGYEVDNNLFPFTIKQNGQVLKCQMTDVPKSTPVLPKTGDIDVNGIPLASKICFALGAIMLVLTGRYYLKSKSQI